MFDINRILKVTSSKKDVYVDEADFERCLSESLRDSGYKVTNQKSFQCEDFHNSRNIIPDIIVEHGGTTIVMLELKYVIINLESKLVTHTRNHDLPAFSYDILKDCAKAESLIKKGVVKDSRIIALTNVRKVWEGRGPKGWSFYFGQAIRDDVGAKIQGLIKTSSINRNDEAAIDKAIFNQHRYHIFLEYEWTVEWLDYSQVKCKQGNGKLRALVLTPNLKKSTLERRLEKDLDSKTVPFISESAKNRALDLKGTIS
ncbi:hypothetical protein [Vibrio anguillarum]|uniref:hypothetical protein n=1 Tax=Vibrio anguillarum TaxID=55601 RepID=UPI002FE4AA17